MQRGWTDRGTLCEELQQFVEVMGPRWVPEQIQMSVGLRFRWVSVPDEFQIGISSRTDSGECQFGMSSDELLQLCVQCSLG